MRIAILADVHANREALEAVLRHAEGQRALEGLWCLGDTVGYGPDPGPCLGLLRRYPLVALAGNHDWAAIGRLSTEDFNPDAATAAHWTASHLAPEERSYLEGLPEVVEQAVLGRPAYEPSPGRVASGDSGPAAAEFQQRGDFTLVHGTLRWPIWEYLFSQETAVAHLQRQRTPYSLVGHTHVPMLVVEASVERDACRLLPLDDGQAVPLSEQRLGHPTKSQISWGPRLVINPGGVGQPRDGDPRASYAVLDTEARTVTLHRVEYDIAATQRKMARVGLPAWLIYRLSYGR